MSEERPGPGELLRAALRGALRPRLLVLALGAALVALALAGLAAGLGVKGKVALGGAALVAWGQGAAWLVTGELQRLDAALTDLAGAAWLVFGAVWWLPVALVWIVLGAAL